MLCRSRSRLRIKCSDEFRIVKHFFPHAYVLAPDRTVYYRLVGVGRNAASRSWRYRAVNNGEIRLVPPDIFRDLANKLFVAERKTNVHHVASIHRCSQRNIDSKDLVAQRNDLGQRFPYLTDSYDYYVLGPVFLFHCESSTKPQRSLPNSCPSEC